MINSSPSTRYPSAIIALHWLIFILVVLGYCAMEFRGIFEKGTAERELMKSAHFTIGLSILMLTVARILVRATSGSAPPITPPIADLQARAAKGLHLLLYALLVTMPLLGWLTLSAEGKIIPFFGIAIPALTGADKGFAETVGEWHATLGTIGYGLIGLHAVAAIVHHSYFKDNTLTRMIPGRNAVKA